MAQARRVEVGGQLQQSAQRSYQAVEGLSDPLSELLLFPAVTIGFCCLRLLRPIIVLAVYDGGPKDDVAAAANVLVWLAAISGIMGAINVSTPWKEWLKVQGATPRLTWKLEPAAVALLMCAVVMDILHQLFALISFNLFWSTGIAGANNGESDGMLAFFLVILHIGGLFGSIGMVAAYARCCRASWRKYCRGPPPGYAADHRPPREAQIIGSCLTFVDWLWAPWPDREKPRDDGGDVETGRRPKKPIDKSFTPDAVPTPSRANSGASASSSEAEKGPRKAGAAERSPPGPRASGSSRPPPVPSRSHSAPDSTREGNGSARVEPEPQSSVGSPPRAWFWTGESWVAVRIMRSMPEGVVVRLAGGTVVTTKQHLLRPRVDASESPPSAPPAASGAASSAGPSRPRDERRRPSWSPGPAAPPTSAPQDSKDSGRRSSRPTRPSSAPPSGRAAPSAVPSEPVGEGVAWAAERMQKLRKELQALDGKSHAERRFALRQLQRELHPDKQPPEMRSHAQPLFMMVQKEWEISEASAKANKE